MSVHRWWMALVAALLTPWIGAHIDRYLPVGWLLIEAADASADAGFWIAAGVLLAIGYAVWLLVLTAIGAGVSRLRRPR